MMNILKHELKQNKNTTIIWTIAIMAVMALYISIFPSVGEEFLKITESFPSAFKKAFGIPESGISTFPSLYAFSLSLTILIGAMQAMNLGVGIISKEVRYKTADFLLTKPMSRLNILTQKILSGLSLLIITNIVFIGGTWGLINIFVKDIPTFEAFLTVSAVFMLTQLFFFALGFLVGAALPKVKSVIAVTLPTVFGFYVFGMLDTVIGEKIKYLTPFKLFDLEGLASGSAYELGSLIFLGFLLVIFVGSSLYIYQRKDIHTV